MVYVCRVFDSNPSRELTALTAVFVFSASAGEEMKVAVQNLTIFFHTLGPSTQYLGKKENEEETIMMLNTVVTVSTKLIF